MPRPRLPFKKRPFKTRKPAARVNHSARKANRRALLRTLQGLPPDFERAPFIASEIVALRQILGLTRDALARQVGVQPFTVKQWEMGRRLPSRLYSAALFELARMNHLDIYKLDDREYVTTKLEVRVHASSSTEKESQKA